MPYEDEELEGLYNPSSDTSDWFDGYEIGKTEILDFVRGLAGDVLTGSTERKVLDWLEERFA